jgi:hypothetical protein
MNLDTANWKYLQQRAQSRRRAIPFNITFAQWYELWTSSGHLDDRGIGAGQYCMSRYGDAGAYEIGNVFIQLSSDNVKQAQLGATRTLEAIVRSVNARKGFKHTTESKQKLSIVRRGQKSANPFAIGHTPWNKGLTKADPRVAAYGITRTNNSQKENKSCV